MVGSYPVTFDVDYPDRPLDRLTTAFRSIDAIPIQSLALLKPRRGVSVSAR
jgi:hypothetical protein